MGNASWVLILMGFILLILLVTAVFVIKMAKVRKKEYVRTGQHPKGHYLGQGMAIGIPIGIAIMVPVGIAMQNISLGVSTGPAIGVAIGVAIGTAWEKKHEDELRPLTEQEEAMKRKTLLFLVGVLLFGVVAAVSIWFFNQ